MMTFESPAPGSRGCRSSEEGNVGFVRVTAFAAIGFFATFEEVEHFFEAAELERFGVTGGREAGLDEFFGSSASGSFNIAENDAVAFLRNEMPVQPFGIAEFVAEFLLQISVKAVEEFGGGRSHSDTWSITAVISADRMKTGESREHKGGAGDETWEQHREDSGEKGGRA
jgi:hypothetical protein